MSRATIRRTTAIGLLIVGLIVVWTGAVAPYLTRRGALEDRIAQAAAAAERFEGVLAAARNGETARFPAGLVLDGTSQAVAQAALQERLDTAIEISGGTRTASIMLDPAEAAEQLYLRARVEGEVTIDALADLLHGLETTYPLVFVETVEIARRNRLDADANAAEGPVALDLRLTARAPVDIAVGASE